MKACTGSWIRVTSLVFAALLAGCGSKGRTTYAAVAPVGSGDAVGVDSGTATSGSGVAAVDTTLAPQLEVVTTELRFPAQLAHAAWQLEARGGAGTYTWQAAEPLPSGLTLSPAGVVSGVPAQAGRFVARLEVRDAEGTFAARDVEVEVVDPVLEVVAGNGVPGFAGDGGPAEASLLDQPCGAAVDAAGRIYVADRGNHRVRRVETDGTITTVAGSGVAGFSGDGGPAVSAALDAPTSLALDPRTDDLYVFEAGNNRVRRIEAATRVISTVAGNGTTAEPTPGAFAVDSGLGSAAGNLIAVGPAGRVHLVLDRLFRVEAGRLVALTGTRRSTSRGPSNLPALASWVDRSVWGLAVDHRGDVYVSELVQVRKIDADTGALREVVGRDQTAPTLNASAGDGGLALDATFDRPGGLAIDAAGNLFVTDSFGFGSGARVRRVDAVTQVIETVAGGARQGTRGAGQRARAAELAGRGWVALDGRGNVYVVDQDAHRLVRIGAPRAMAGRARP